MKELHSRLDQALQQALAKLGADSGTIHLKEPDRKVLRLMASQAIPAPILEVVREVPWGKGMAGIAAERAVPVDSCNLQTSQSPDIEPGAKGTGVQGAIVVPMMHGTEVVGTFGVGCKRERTFSPEETRWLLDFGRDLAMEIGAPTV